MKKIQNQILRSSIALSVLVSGLSAYAGGITNNFTTAADFLANGVLGTMWDGVYLKDGDVPGGGGGGGSTIQANETTFPGYLTVQSTSGGWAGSQSDGFYLYKMVSGDFDVSVQNAAPYDSQNYTFGGLLVRAAYFQNGAALPAGENWLNITRFQEFGLGDGVRFATNGADNEFLYTGGSDSDTNTSRYFRITRAGNVFSFYNRTNAGDAWALQTTLTRGDLTGLPMQVGIQQAVFTPNTPVNYFTDFQLVGPNVAVGTAPANPSGITTSVVNSNSVTVSWTPGSGSAGSVVLLHENGSINHKPADGFVYAGNTNFADAGGLLGGSGVHAVYVGTGSSVTITGLGGSNNLYSVAVVSYQGVGAATTYGVNPSTNSFAGPGTLVSVGFTVSPTIIPINGVSVASLTATYSSGDSYDVSAAPGTVWGSSNPGAISVNNGILSGLVVGSSLISATYAGITGNQTVSAATPAFTDNFDVSHNYVTAGVPGSAWDGIYLNAGDIPGGTGLGLTTVASANSVTNNSLVVTAKETDWAGADNDGFLLFKRVSGDFQAAVHIKSLQRINYQFGGLMARAANANGGPYGGSENWVNMGQFSEFGISIDVRSVVNGADSENVVPDGNTAADFWLLMRRAGDTFTFYRKVDVGDSWTPLPNQTTVRSDLAGVPLQVGLFQAIFTANLGTVSFENFMLDAAGLSAGTPPPVATGLTNTPLTATSLKLSWTPGAGSTGSVVVVRAGKVVNQQPANGVVYTGNTAFGSGSDLGSGNYVVYVGSGNTVTVTGLAPGTTYYAVVYSYGGTAGSPVYNRSVPPTGQNTIVMGTPSSITAVGPNRIPAGGLGKMTVYVNFSGGFVAKVSSGLSFSSDNTNVVLTVGTNNLLTGLTNGSANITAIYTEGATSFTNTVAVSVGTPTFTDNFGVSHDYKAAGVAGTAWDGVYATPGTLPGTTFVSDPAAAINSADANTTSNNWLTVSTLNVGWENDQNDGFFLFKKVTGDFQVATHIGDTLLEITETATNELALYNNPGLLARAYTGSGAPFVGGTNESWVSWTRFDLFGIGTYARRTLNNGTTQNGQPGRTDGEYWLLMVRESGTNFSFYQRKFSTDPWKPAPSGTTYSVADFASQPMQVGLLACAFDSGNTAIAQFGNFMLDTGLPSMQVTHSGNNAILSWPVGPGVLQSTFSLNPVNWQTVTATSTTNAGIISVSLPATNAASFFRLVR